MKKGVGSGGRYGYGGGSGSGSISKRYKSGDPDPHQNVTDPQHWQAGIKILVVPRSSISSVARVSGRYPSTTTSFIRRIPKKNKYKKRASLHC